MRNSEFSLFNTVLLAGAITLLVVPFVQACERASAKRRDLDDQEARVDKNLKDTFPASDPPASHFTDIPVNRRQ